MLQAKSLEKEKPLPLIEKLLDAYVYWSKKKLFYLPTAQTYIWVCSNKIDFQYLNNIESQTTLNVIHLLQTFKKLTRGTNKLTKLSDRSNWIKKAKEL